MKIVPEDLTEGLSSGRRRTRFGLTGVEAEAGPRRQGRLFRCVAFLLIGWEGLWKVRMSRAGIGSNTSLKQNAPHTLRTLVANGVTFCLARIR